MGFCNPCVCTNASVSGKGAGSISSAAASRKLEQSTALRSAEQLSKGGNDLRKKKKEVTKAAFKTDLVFCTQWKTFRAHCPASTQLDGRIEGSPAASCTQPRWGWGLHVEPAAALIACPPSSSAFARLQGDLGAAAAARGTGDVVPAAAVPSARTSTATAPSFLQHPRWLRVQEGTKRPHKQLALFRIYFLKQTGGQLPTQEQNWRGS